MGRYKATSVKNIVKRRHAQEYGMERDSKPWTQEESDKLLDLWFAGRKFLGPNGLVAALHRSVDGVKSRLWKLFTRYRSPDHATSTAYEYEPSCRNGRYNLPFNDAENYALALATGEDGRKNNAHDLLHLSELMMRHYVELEDYFDKLYKQRQTTLLEDPNPTPDAIAKTVHKVLKTVFDGVEKSIAREITKSMKGKPDEGKS